MLRRFLLGLPIWTLVVGASAAPSFLMASSTSLEGRLLGIAVWIFIYSLLTSTDFFVSRWRLRPERTAICIAYGIRALLGVAMFSIPHLLLVDMYTGLLSVHVAELMTSSKVIRMGAAPGPLPEIVPTALATFLQGLQLSVITFVLLLVIRAICIVSMDEREDDGPRGFEVVMPPKPDDPAPPR